MHLSKFCDYALRALMYLGARPGKVVAASEIAHAFGVSTHHMVKSLQSLCRQDLVRSVAGRGGGYVFERPPTSVRLGQVVQGLEPHFHLAECFAPQADSCPLTPECGLQHALGEARDDFIDALDRYTLEDLVHSQQPRLLAIGDP